MPGYRIVKIDNRQEAERFMREIGADDAGVKLMAPKAVFRAVKIRDISCRAANIIKQEMLSKGGEAAVRRGTINGEGKTDILLLGTLQQYRLLTRKLKMQPFGLKKLAVELEAVLKQREAFRRTVLKLPRGGELVVGERTLIMGILNITPDSFSDGGQFFGLDNALTHARQMVEDGADIIDIGGFSTRPGAQEVTPEEEINRVLPVIKELRREYNGPISIDTFRAEVAEAALLAGADIVNDVSGLKYDPLLAPLIAKASCPVILMHNKLDKEYQDIMAELIEQLEECVHIALDYGIDENQIIIDPGIGFGKTPEQNLAVIKNMTEMLALGRPILLGVSRKSFIGKLTDLPPTERIEGSMAAAVMGIMNGASILRVHDVKETKRAAVVVDAIMRA